MENIRAIERGFLVLEILSNYSNGIGVTELCTIADLPKATISRILTTLIQLGYVEQDIETSKYNSTFKQLEIGIKKLNDLDISKSLRPYLNDLSEKTNETIHLVIRDNLFGVYIDKFEPHKYITMNTRIGMRKSLTCTAFGKVLLSEQSEEEVSDIWTKSTIKKHTANTLVDFQEFLGQLQKVKIDDYALDNEEVEMNVSCISVPVRNYSNKIVAAVSLSYLCSDTPAEKIPVYISTLKEYSKILSTVLGYSGTGK